MEESEKLKRLCKPLQFSPEILLRKFTWLNHPSFLSWDSFWSSVIFLDFSFIYPDLIVSLLLSQEALFHVNVCCNAARLDDWEKNKGSWSNSFWRYVGRRKEEKRKCLLLQMMMMLYSLLWGRFVVCLKMIDHEKLVCGQILDRRRKEKRWEGMKREEWKGVMREMSWDWGKGFLGQEMCMNICAKYGCLRHTVQFFQRTFFLLVSVFNLRFKGKEML